MTLSSSLYAQNHKFAGTVVDANGEPIIGATVNVKGSKENAITDIDGRFSISAAPGQTLVINYIGFSPLETKAADNMQLTLNEDRQTLNDVVVVGYGVQKKSVVTASIAKVSADDLAGTAPVRVDNALKGLASGVTVTSASGQPGAIYGTRAANGVILVTTKGGEKGKMRVNYNFSYGWQNPWKHRDVLNATEYAVMMNEGLVNAGQAPIYNDPYSYGKGTDWQDEVFNDNAGVTSHEVNLSGASDRVNYYLSLGYFHQYGIVGGNYDRSNYRRLTMRSNTTYTVFDDQKERSLFNKLSVGVNLSYARVSSKSIEANSQWGSPLGSALYLSPILTPTVSGAEADAQASLYGSQYMIYETVISDLESAISLNALPMKWDDNNIGRISQAAAYMIYAEMVMYQNDEARYQKALSFMQQIINDTDNYDLNPDYAGIFLESGEWTKESIFEICYKDDNAVRAWGDGVVNAGGTIYPRLIGPAGGVPEDGVDNGWGFEPVREETYNMFAEGDVRRDATVYDARKASYTKRYQDTGLWLKKYLPYTENNKDQNADGDLNFNNNLRIYRFAETLLNATELLVRTNGDLSKAQQYLNLVHHRAGLADNRASTIDNIIDERHLEFVGEGKRYWDLVRTGKAASTLTPDAYGYRTNTWSESKKYLPIPLSEIDAAHGTIKQNNY